MDRGGRCAPDTKALDAKYRGRRLSWMVGDRSVAASLGRVIRVRRDPRDQCVNRQPVAIFFSAAYLAAASLTMGAITLSSLVYQSDEIFQSLPSQVWVRPTRAPSWSAQDTLIGCSTPSKPSCLTRSAVRLRRGDVTLLPLIGAHRPVRDGVNDIGLL